MMKLYDITKKYGKATYAYPFEPYKVSENFRGQPEYNFDQCICCAACGIACPSNAIQIKLNETQDKLVWEFSASRCIFCGRCDEVCPTGAIHLGNSFELAVKFDKSALIQRGEFEVQKCKHCGKVFTTKRLLNFTYKKLESANLVEGRLENAKDYLEICQECKQSMCVERMTKGVEKEIQ